MITPISGGFRVAETDTHYVDVMEQLFNWRICLVPKVDQLYIERHWCYAGKGVQTLLAAIAAGQAWILAGDDEPAGWNKNGQTGEWRRPAVDGAGADGGEVAHHG